LDDFLIKDQNGFLEHLRYSKLIEKIHSCNHYVIEGICLLDVLARLDCNIDKLIYIKNGLPGRWETERDCCIKEGVEEFIEREIFLINDIARLQGKKETCTGLGISGEIIRYHASFKPNESNDLVYWQNDC